MVVNVVLADLMVYVSGAGRNILSAVRILFELQGTL